MTAVQLSGLKKYFGKTKALDGVTLKVEKGEAFGFLGPNGAGKTTTIRCMMDFIQPSAGRIKIFGQDAHAESSELKRKIGYLGSDNHLYEKWTGTEHINFIKKLHGINTSAQDLIEQLKYDPTIKIKHLSTGNRQKLGIILALLKQPELLILDEPTQGLDPILQNEIYSLLQKFRASGGTIFMSSHNLAEVQRMCDRVAVIRKGKLATQSTVQTLRSKTSHIVSITLTSKLNTKDYQLPSVKIMHHSNRSITLKVKGNLDPILHVLARKKVKDLEVTHPSLEEIFLELYK